MQINIGERLTLHLPFTLLSLSASLTLFPLFEYRIQHQVRRLHVLLFFPLSSFSSFSLSFSSLPPFMCITREFPLSLSLSLSSPLPPASLNGRDACSLHNFFARDVISLPGFSRYFDAASEGTSHSSSSCTPWSCTPAADSLAAHRGAAAQPEVDVPAEHARRPREAAGHLSARNGGKPACVQCS